MLVCRSCLALFVKEPGKKGPSPKYCSDECRMQGRGRRSVSTHGQHGYGHGCRCETCCSAHQDRMRAYQQCRGGNLNRNPETEKAYRKRVGSARKLYPDTHRANDQLRRARKMTPDAERLDSREVFDRDGWVCGICGDPVNPGLRYPDPGSVSLDHIVPLSRGGAHTRANAQCAHLGCNIAKGARASA